MRGRRRLFLLLAPALLAGVLSGCATETPAPAEGKPPGDSWVVVTQGSVAPTATPGGRTPSPGMSTGFLPLSSASPRVTRTPAPNCTGFQRQGQINGILAVPGVGSVSMTWYNPGGSNLVSYRVTAIPQQLVTGNQPGLRWKTITPEKDCGMMTTVVTGLKKGQPYMLSMDAVVTRRNSDGDVGSTIARSGVFYPL
jgi:hypothetical protein